MADLGNLNDSLRLKCKHCEYLPPDAAKMEAVQLHCQVEHDTDKVELDLLPLCTCGAAMEHTFSKPMRGGTWDHFRCAACGNTGHCSRDGKDPRPRRG